jgi:hypothetical protein
VADENHKPLATRDAGVEEISLQHCILLREDRDDHDGIFRPLALVDGGGIGGNQRVKLAERRKSPTARRARHEFDHLLIDGVDIADVRLFEGGVHGRR